MPWFVSGSVQTLVSEVTKMLRRQRCSPEVLRWFLKRAGFSVTQWGEDGMGVSGEGTLIARAEP